MKRTLSLLKRQSPGIGLTPLLKRTLGQHLLVNAAVLDDMMIAGEVKEDDTVLEIGPGTGMLTTRLLEKAKCVKAFEYDTRMIASLEKIFPNEIASKKLMITNADFAKVDVPDFSVCVANIPYQISSIVVSKLLLHPSKYSSAVLMVQEEFAQRLIAEPGNKNYSRLTVNTSLVADVTSVRKVPKGNFNPPPKVDSRVIKIVRHENPVEVDQRRFDGMLRCCFHRKNKTLRAAFTAKSALQQMKMTTSDSSTLLKENVEQVLHDLNMAQNRAVKLSKEELLELFHTFEKADIDFITTSSKYLK